MRPQGANAPNRPGGREELPRDHQGLPHFESEYLLWLNSIAVRQQRFVAGISYVPKVQRMSNFGRDRENPDAANSRRASKGPNL
jgi:hypothetical protein